MRLSSEKMDRLHVLSVLLTLLWCKCNGSDLEYDGKLNIRLDHSLVHTHTPVYSHRGDILIKSLHTGAYAIDELTFTNDQIKLLQNLARQNGNYRVRATAKTSEGKEIYFYTFVKACSLIESHLKNVISVNLDDNGNVIAVTMTVPKICAGSDVKPSSLINFNTSVEVRHMELGPVPDTATYIQRLEREREAKERGETKDNRSFFAKYWMYIVPVVIFMLLQSAANLEPGGAGGSGGGSGAPAQR